MSIKMWLCDLTVPWDAGLNGSVRNSQVDAAQKRKGCVTLKFWGIVRFSNQSIEVYLAYTGVDACIYGEMKEYSLISTYI